MPRSFLLSSLVGLMACGGGRTAPPPASDTASSPSAASSGFAATADTGVALEAHTLRLDGSRAVDLLFVVDDSGSMEDNQETLARGFGRAIVSILGSGVDWHVGVVSMDMDSAGRPGAMGELVTVASTGERFLHAETPDAQAAFESLVTLGTDGYGAERGLEALYTALEVNRDTVNAGFLRDTADLHAVLISDENDDGSAGFVTGRETAEWLTAIKASPARAQAHAVVNLEPSVGSMVGRDYIDLAEGTGGLVADIATISELDYQVLGEALIPPTPTPVLEPEPVAGSVTVVFEHADGSATELVEGVDFEVVPGTGAASIAWLGAASQAGDTIVVGWEALP